MSPPPKDRTLLLVGGGAAVAVVAGIGLAVVILDKSPPPAEPTVGQMGLVVESRAPEDDSQPDPARPLRCFVAGAMVGELTLADCAKRNGVAAGSLDVGLDANGQLAAAQTAGTLLTPLPPETPPAEALPAASPPETAPPAAAPAQAPTQAQPMRVSVGICSRYEAGGWQRLPSELTLAGCVQALYAGRCERPGGAAYGRWGDQTLRLVPRRVEVSTDGRTFRTLTDQSEACILSPIAG